MNKQPNTQILVKTALATALVWVCTTLLRVPVAPDCYIHLGDTVIMLSALILPLPYAVFASSVGATLADLIGGFPFWAPWTFAIKALMVIAVWIFYKRGRLVLGLIASSIAGVFGYFVSECILFGSIAGALLCAVFNIIQVVLASILTYFIFPRIQNQKL